MARRKKEFSIRDLIFIAIFTAMICLISPWTINSQNSIPVTLATFIICFTAAVLGFKRGLLCVIIYLLLGILGVPVFANWTGGYKHFLSNSAGYLVGYLLLITIAGLIIDANPKNAYMFFVGMIVGAAVCFLCGAGWLMIKTSTSFTGAWNSGIRPYLSFECIKIFCAAMLGYPLRGLVKRITG